MSRRHLSDNVRASLSTAVALPVAVAASLLVLDDAGAGSFVALYLPFWPTFALTYLVWTHVAYASADPSSLGGIAHRERRSRSRWWNHWLFGLNDASSLTLMGAVVAVILTLTIAQDPAYRSDVLYVVLGLLTVASSWALMVYSFALDYLRLDADLRQRREAHIDFHTAPSEGDSTFGDYLTFAVLASTMAATISADVGSRAVWRLVRTNVLVAFGFNSVIVAMVVSLLFGGLAA